MHQPLQQQGTLLSQKHLLNTTNANQSFNKQRYLTTTATPKALTPINSIEVVTDDVRNNNLPSTSLAAYAFYHQTSSPSPPPPPIPPSLSSTVKNNNNSINKKQTLERRNSLISLHSQHRTPTHISVDDNIIHGSNNPTIYQMANSPGNNGGKRSPAMIYHQYHLHNSQKRQNYAASTIVTSNSFSDSMSMLDNDNFISSKTTLLSSSMSQSKLTNSNTFYHSPPLPPLLLHGNASNVSHQMSPKSTKCATGGCEELSPYNQTHYLMNNKQQFEWIEQTGVKVPTQPITISTQPGLGGYWMQLENNDRIWCTTDSK